jgi:hypothetical protein
LLRCRAIAMEPLRSMARHGATRDDKRALAALPLG